MFRIFLSIVLIILVYIYTRPKKCKEPTEVRIRMPINVINPIDGSVHNPELLETWIYKLYKANVDGAVIDVIWGIVEREKGKFDFDGYKKLIKMLSKYDLKVTCVLSFHKCDGIPLPKHILENQFFCKDQNNVFDDQYMSPFFDSCIINNEATPIMLYSKFMIEFKNAFDEEIQDGIIDTIGVSLGPDGELKYPSFRGNWTTPGSGCIQCFDEVAKDFLNKEGIDIPDFDGVNDYNTTPINSQFWNGIEENAPAKKFFDWYNNKLCEHAEKVLIEARRILGENINIFSKVPCIDLYSEHPSHAAEANSGLYSFNDDGAYERFARSFAKFGIELSISGLEKSEDANTYSNPKKVIEEAKFQTINMDIPFRGENKEEDYSANAIINILSWANTDDNNIKYFTFNRLSDETMRVNNWVMLNELIRKLHATKY